MASANSGDINLASGMFFRCTLSESQTPPFGYTSPFGYGIILRQIQDSENDKRYEINYLVQKSTGNVIIRCVLKKFILGVTNTLYLVSTDLIHDSFDQIFNFEMAVDDSVISQDIRRLLTEAPSNSQGHDEYTDYDNSQGSSQGSSYYDSSQGSSQGSFYYPKELGGGKRSRKRKNNTKRRKSRKSKRRRNKKSKRR
jgi:hypothetical protein